MGIFDWLGFKNAGADAASKGADTHLGKYGSSYLQGATLAVDLGLGIDAAIKQGEALKLQRENLAQMRDQLKLENDRWDKREKERLDTNASFNSIGSKALLEHEKKSAQDLGAVGAFNRI